MARRARLHERYIRVGSDTLHNYEIVELLLSYAIPRKEIKPIAKELLKKFGSIRNIIDADISEIEQVHGIGKSSAILVKLVKDILLHYLQVVSQEKAQINCTEELLGYCNARLGALK